MASEPMAARRATVKLLPPEVGRKAMVRLQLPRRTAKLTGRRKEGRTWLHYNRTATAVPPQGRQPEQHTPRTLRRRVKGCSPPRPGHSLHDEGKCSGR